MTLPEASVRRPVATVAAALLTTVAGLIALTALPIREYPAIDPPTLSVTTSYAGAAAEVVETQITEPLEAAINTVGGITTLRSSSREGVSQITVEFSLDTDLDAAASDVRDQVARTARRLPPDVEPPILNKADADSQPILGLALRSERRSQLELGEFANDLKSVCRRCRVSPRCRSPRRSAMRCASGSTPTSCAPTISRRSTFAPPSSARTSSCRPAASRASRSSSPSRRSPGCRRRRNSPTW